MNTTECMYFTDYNHFVCEMYSRFNRDNQGQRIGQFAVNFLRNNFIMVFDVPDEVDCFYNDLLLGDFLTWVSANWNV